MTLMFQREVAERIVAAPGSKAYGRLGVLAGWRSEARILFDIEPRAFTPPPKVTSSVVGFVPRPAPLPADTAVLERVVAAAFGQRRKMLRQSLKIARRRSASRFSTAAASRHAPGRGDRRRRLRRARQRIRRLSSSRTEASRTRLFGGLKPRDEIGEAALADALLALGAEDRARPRRATSADPR